jgi:predicted transposase YbfD/YdcC
MPPTWRSFAATSPTWPDSRSARRSSWSSPAAPHDSSEIAGHTRRHWGIENLEHRPRDTIWYEDDPQVYTGNGPRTMATLRNLALGLFSLHGITKIKQMV